ncbi:hypothetical protein [Xanthomonas sp. SHU 199]|uniref:hypothetical protein n=1 Tax=Xanthomonas sp. SHU 199 TaxID=1591174 RepID=UPI00037400ED|nr:hypothetical protein [Xanthomonas sp. SHU 199]
MSTYQASGEGADQCSLYGIKLAMALLGKNKHYAMHSIQRRHFSSTAQKVGYAPSAEPIIEEILARTPAAIAEVRADLPQDISPRVVDAILGGIEQAALALEGMPAS